MKKLTVAELKDKCFKKNWHDLPLYPRLVTFRVSIRFVRLLQNTWVTPNIVTLLSLLVAFITAFFFVQGNVFTFLLGAFLLEFYYALDCTDGQLARLKGLCSKEGAFVDYLLNYMVHPLIFFSIGLGCYFASGNIFFVITGAISAWAMVLGYALSDCKHAIIVANLVKDNAPVVALEKCSTCTGRGKNTLPKRVFKFMHKITTYPTIMNIITVTAIFSIVLGNMNLIYLISILFALDSSIVFLLRACNLLKGARVSDEYEQVKRKILVKEDIDEKQEI